MKKNYYVKFFGTSNKRAPLNRFVRDEIKEWFCHQFCCFRQSNRVNRFNDGDVIYMARLTSNPNDITIFGKAEAVKFIEERDKPIPKPIADRWWGEDCAVCLGVKNPIFMDGTLEDGVSLYGLIERLGHDSFLSTQKRHENGETNINPRLSLTQQPYVRLTLEAVEWIEENFNKTIGKNGQVDDTFYHSLT